VTDDQPPSGDDAAPEPTPSGDEQAWRAIVAALSAEGVGQGVLGSRDRPDATAPARPTPPPPNDPTGDPWVGDVESEGIDSVRTPGATASTGTQHVEDHFVPPEPPPLPRGDAVSRLAWGGVLGGPAFLLLMVVLQLRPATWLVALAVLSFVAGFAVLVARLPATADDRDPGDGAVV
jgi:hypothetical protein